MDITKPKLTYWSTAVLGLMWNLIGCMNYLGQTDPNIVTQLPDAYQAAIAARPAWATIAFAVSVFGGAVGCILLLLRRKVALQVLSLSLVAVVLTFLSAIMSGGINFEVLIPTTLSVIVAALLVWMARLATKAGWLR